MNAARWLIVGFIATVVLTTLSEGSQGLRLTRMNLPYMLGTMFTPDRDRAKVYGALVHFINGWLFSLLYLAIFHTLHIFNPFFGALVGFAHGLFVLVVGLPVLPGIHPRMAGNTRGPTVDRQLEPPGFMGLHYGIRTPITVLVAHIAFGAVLGGVYRPPGS
ncbi:MAG: hypothetical protein IRZ16_12540 [Myxococcaceae bacterium]|nr:hypothetical protein [Myxococcaceae bacterium]